MKGNNDKLSEVKKHIWDLITILTIVVMISFSLLLFTACGKKVADEEQIKQELETNQNIRFLNAEEKIEELVIEKRQTDKEEKLDKVWCEVKISDAEVTVVKKVVLGIKVSTEIAYWYKEGTGWEGNVTDIASTVETADIEGIWSGIYRDIFDGEAELSISELKEDGSVKAVYTFKPHDSASASYELSGTWNQDTLQFVLEAGDWIKEPKKITISNDKYDTIVELNVREERLQGTAQGNRQIRLYKETE